MSNPLLAQLPAVHVLADAAAAVDGATPRWALVEAARRSVATKREQILAGGGDPSLPAGDVAALAAQLARPAVARVVNATGDVLHTHPARAPFPGAALAR